MEVLQTSARRDVVDDVRQVAQVVVDEIHSCVFGHQLADVDGIRHSVAGRHVRDAPLFARCAH
jgi:hypothetical protein